MVPSLATLLSNMTRQLVSQAHDYAPTNPVVPPAALAAHQAHVADILRNHQVEWL